MKAAQYLFGVLRGAGTEAVFATGGTDASVVRRAEEVGLRAIVLASDAAAWEAARAYGQVTGAPAVVLASDTTAAAGVLLDDPLAADAVACDTLGATAAGPALLTLDPRAARAEYQPPPADVAAHAGAEDLPEAAIEEAALLLSLAARPVIWAGAGAVRAGAAAGLEVVAESLGAPILTSVGGKGVVGERYPYAVGSVFEAREAALLLRDSDAALAVGTTFSARSTRSGQLPMPMQLFHVDRSAAVVGRRYPARMGLAGDARQVVAALAGALATKERGNQLADPAARAASVRDAARGRLREAAGPVAEGLDGLRAAIPEEVVTVWDLGPARWAVPLFPVPVAGTFVAPPAGAEPGSALAAVTGVAAAGRPVVAVITQDQILRSAGDLAAIGRGQLPLVILAVGGEGWTGEARPSPVRSMGPTGVAGAFGLAGVAVGGLDELPGALAAALAGTKPTLLSLSL